MKTQLALESVNIYAYALALPNRYTILLPHVHTYMSIVLCKQMCKEEARDACVDSVIMKAS